MLQNLMTNTANQNKIQQILSEFRVLIKDARATKPKGWQFKVKNYSSVINILSQVDALGLEVTDTASVLVHLRDGGMKFAGEPSGGAATKQWKSKILQRIEEIIQHGFLASNQQIKEDPKTQAISLLTSIPEIGPSKATQLYQQGITSIEMLQARPELVNRKQLIGLRHYQDLTQRIPRSEMLQWEESLQFLAQETLSELEITLHQMQLTGSFRRQTPTSGDVDFSIAVREGEDISHLMEDLKDALIATSCLQPEDVISYGPHKLMCVARISPVSTARHLDIFIFHEAQFPFALLFATGSGEFNIKLRNHALQLGWSLSDKALCQGQAGGPPPTSQQLQEKIGKPDITDERDIFHFLGIEYITPSERTPTVSFTLRSDI